ncbi:NAD(P)/FAD-dependent oxidoreductase [Streptomyces cavernicola]|uniref:FAD-dependent oxidoreductase n=1 Tax=Streptomyces cavernicola TaxID=3043613 RepID=A0ABT6SEA4_9ACTN|nr:FAD-dependent oxidoreductase [Streptomyces sp. B-S-A6]MDI3406305.1 FAD-dependent oxidoreductase [Streptomyces sp. B-S-A6]
MGSQIVVIGAGTAGVRLAQQLAQASAAGGTHRTPPVVTLLGDEQHAPYNRVLLAEVLAGRYGPEVIALPSPAPVRRGRVERIDREDRFVHVAGGGRIAYDKLVLATGSNPVLPPLRGLFTEDRPGLPDGVHAFRTMDDCLALSKAVREGSRAVVIGGGLLGVSAARALAERGAQVVLAQQGERLMERQLDATASDLVRQHLTGNLGVEVHTECRVRALTTEGGAVTGVTLADGYALDADLVVLACGVRPRVGLAQQAGLDVRRGVVVDDELRTSDPHIHAIGDCAEHDGRVYGLAAPAIEQADALAELILKDDGNVYTGTRALTRLTLNVTGPATNSNGTGTGPLDLATFGESDPLPGDDVVRLADATRGTYRQVVVRDDRLVGGVLLGELGTVGALARAWEAAEPLPQAPLLHLLTPDGPDGGS